mmetsp:Transcript_21888/g.67161  ORF Transcript_21888/g.67161 Transcript_21888/m.67161 type:complete len:804 (-) Transcript_21888:139-2550(-)
MSPSPAAKGVQLLSSLSALVSVARPPQLEPAAAAYARVLQRTDGVVGASLLPSALEGSYFLTLRRSARDVDNDERRRSSLHLLFNGDVGVTAAAPFPTPTPADVVLDSAAPSGQRRVVFRKSGDAPKAEAGIPSAQKYVADVYAGHRVVRRLNVDGVGRLLTDGWFGGASWSPCGRFLTVVAEPKAAPSASHFAASAKGEADKEATRGGGWALREDWGEKYTGVTEPALFVLDTHGEAGGLLRLPLPDGVACVGQPTFRPGGDGGFDDLHVAFTGWLPQPRKLGMIYCYQRPCQIFEASIGGAVARWVGGTEEEGATAEVPVAAVTPALRLARSPRWHPSGDRLAFLGSAEGFETHNGPVFLGIAERGDAAAYTHRVLVPEVEVLEGGSDTELAFPGIWADALPKDTWAASADGSTLALTSAWGSTPTVLLVDAATGAVSRPEVSRSDDSGRSCFAPRAAATVLGAKDGHLVVQSSSPVDPGVVEVWHNEGGGKYQAFSAPIAEGDTITAGTSNPEGPDAVSPLAGRFEVLRVEPDVPTADGRSDPFEAVLVLPSNPDPTVVVVPHGGPHGVFPTSYVPTYAFLVERGFAVLHVNYRGSTGFGAAALRSLAGNCGTQDVSDCLAALRAARDTGLVRKDTAGVCGGSHGGFLTGHLIGQQPDVFGAAVMRNPVTNIASMATVTDIPDWCTVEGAGIGVYQGFGIAGDGAENPLAAPDEAMLSRMHRASPAAHAHRVKTPTLLALGKVDRRVPVSQGLEYYHTLKGLGVPTKALLYPKCDHAIDLPASEADHWVNALLWLEEYLG